MIAHETQTKSIPARWLALPLITLLSLLALPALAASDGDHGPSTMDLIWQAANLAILIGVLFAVARKPIIGFFSDRREEIKSEIDNASQVLDNAEKHFSEWQGKIVDLQGELDEIRATARQRAEDEREHIIAAAHDTAERIKGDAVTAIDQELRRARAELQDEAADLAMDLAAKLLREQVGESDRERLVDEFITRIEPGTAPSETGNQ